MHSIACRRRCRLRRRHQLGPNRAIDSVLDAIPRQADSQVNIYIDDFDVTARAPH